MFFTPHIAHQFQVYHKLGAMSDSSDSDDDMQKPSPWRSKLGNLRLELPGENGRIQRGKGAWRWNIECLYQYINHQNINTS